MSEAVLQKNKRLQAISLRASGVAKQLSSSPRAAHPSRSGTCTKKACATQAIFMQVKRQPGSCLLGEGIFTMGYSKNCIMYWGFYKIIISSIPQKVCTNLLKYSMFFYAFCTDSSKRASNSSRPIFSFSRRISAQRSITSRCSTRIAFALS